MSLVDLYNPYAATNTIKKPKGRFSNKDNWTEANITDSTNRANLILAEYQNQWNIDQWNRENEYNSPAAQMVRYQEAGLNPNLIYGQQNLSAGSPQAANARVESAHLVSKRDQRMQARLSAVTGAINMVLNTIGQFQDVRLREQQIDKVKADAELTMANKGLLSDRRTLMGYDIQKAMADTFMKQFDWHKQSERYSLETTKTRQAIDNMRKQGRLMGEQLSLYGDGLTPSSSILQRDWLGLTNGKVSWLDAFKRFIPGLLDYIGKLF